MEIARTMTTLKRVAAMGLMLALPVIAKGQKLDSTAINNLLEEARAHAALANQDAETLDSYSRSTVSWESHANRLIAIKEHANDLIKDFDQLSSMREEGSPWQQEAIDRVNPLLHEMADHLQATINHFKENKNRTQMQAFRDYAQTNRKFMNRTLKLISDFVEYGETKAKADTLEKTLALPTTAENE